MPRVSGLEMVGMIDPAALPCIVFVTAYDEHALKAFEEHATDYLLKPIDPRRLARTLDWLQGGARPTPRPLPGTDSGLHHIPCLARHRVVLLPLSEVEFVNSELSGVQVVCATRQGMTELTLKLLQERTPFVRCHRQYLVNLDQVAGDRAARQRRRRDRHPQRQDGAGEPPLPARNQGHAPHRLILPVAARRPTATARGAGEPLARKRTSPPPVRARLPARSNRGAAPVTLGRAHARDDFRVAQLQERRDG